LLIRFLDDYYIKLELPQENLKSNLNSSTNQSNIEKSAFLKKSNFSLTSSQITQYKNKGTLNLLPNSQSQNLASYKYLMLDKIVENIIPSHYTIRSLLLTVYETSDPRISFNYIKKKIHCDFSFFSKDALIIIVKMIEIISINKSIESNKLLSELLDYSFDQVIKFLFLIIDQYLAYSTISNKNEKDSKKIFNDLFESSKICPRLFFSCFNCYYLEEDSRKNHAQSLKWIIDKTLLIHPNPFYYKLILNLRSDSLSEFCSRNIVIDLTNFLINKIIKLSSVSSQEINNRNVIANLKNSCILIYRLIFIKNFEKITNIHQNTLTLEKFPSCDSNLINSNTNSYFQILLSKEFEEEVINFLTTIINHQIILSRMRFNLRGSSKSSQAPNSTQNATTKSTTTSDSKKQKSILEMIFEILLESYRVVKDKKYIDLLNDLFIWQKHTIFYYIDIYYYFNDRVKSVTVQKRFDKEILKLIDCTFIKDGHIFVFFNIYHFLIKLFVNIFILEEEISEIPHYENLRKLNKVENSNKNEQTFDQSNLEHTELILENLENFAKILINDIVYTYTKILKSNTMEGKIKVEVKDFYYMKVKNYFENEFLELGENRKYDILKFKIFDIINQKKSEMSKYYKLNAKKFSSNEFNINLSTQRKFSSDKEKKENIYLTKSNSEEESFTLKSSYAININNKEIIYDNNLCGDSKTQLSSTIILQSSPNKENSDKSNHNTSGEMNYTKEDNTIGSVLNTTSALSLKNIHNKNYSLFFPNMKTKIYSNSELYNVKLDINSSNKNAPNLSKDYFSKIENTASFSDYLLNKPKKDLLLTKFGVYFKDNFFIGGSNCYNVNQPVSLFEDVREKYLTLCNNTQNLIKQKLESNLNLISIPLDEEQEMDNQIKFLPTQINENENIYNSSKSKYPVKLRNSITTSYMRPFLKPDTKFFNSKFTKISHAYYFSSDANSQLNKNMSTNSLSTNIKSVLQENEPIKIDIDLSVNELKKDTKDCKESNIHINSFIPKSNFINLIPIKPSKILEPLESFKCEHIKLNGVVFGLINIHLEFFSFSSEFDENLYNPEDPSSKLYNESIEYIFSSLKNEIVFKEKEFKIFFKDISEILIRRFLFNWQGVEIFLKNGKSYLFNLFKTAKLEQFFKVILGKSKLPNDQILNINNFSLGVNVVTCCKKYFKDKEFTKKWLNNEISNFEYILLLNKYSSRSYHDVNQYPIFPWIIKDYLDPNLNINDKNIYRSLNYAVSIQNEEKKLLALKKFDDEALDNFKVHFRCHYSTSAFNSFYFMRINPFTQNMIKLQSDKFEHPNRMFNSFRETWDILEKYSDNRELTPEFYFLPEVFLNLNLNNFGVRTDNTRVDNFILPPWSESALDFINKHKSIFENKKVTDNLHQWIDLIFGYNQLIKTKESLNIYPKHTYEQEVNLEKKIEKCFKRGEEENKIIFKIRNKISLILNFGQTPHKLLDEKHAKKEFPVKENKSDIYTFVSDLVWSKTLILKDFNKGIRFFSSSRSFIYVLTGDREIELIDKNKFERKSKIRLKNFLNLNTFSIKDDVKSKNISNLSMSEINRKVSEGKTRQLPIYRDKYTLIELKDCKYFITCRHIDRSIKVYNTENAGSSENLKEILCSSLVCTVIKHPNEKLFYTGEDSGKLTIWSLEYGKNDTLLSVKPITTFQAHEDAITAMLVNEKFNILITGGEDGFVMIRNLYDMELLICFKIEYSYFNNGKLLKNIKKNDNNKNASSQENKNKKQILDSNPKTYKIVDIIFNECNSGLIYVTIFDTDKYILFGYTLNGLKFCELEGLFNNAEVTSNGNLIYGLLKDFQINLCDPVKFDKNILHERKLIEDYPTSSNSSSLVKSNSISICPDLDSFEKITSYFSLLDSKENFMYYCGFDGLLKRSLFLKQKEQDFTEI
jgi:hypothetical protein